MAAVTGEGLAGGQTAPAPAAVHPRRRSFPVWRWIILVLTAIYFLIPPYAALRFAGGAPRPGCHEYRPPALACR